MDRLEREIEAIEDDYTLSQAEKNEAINELTQDYRRSAEQSAQDAYDNELDRW